MHLDCVYRFSSTFGTILVSRRLLDHAPHGTAAYRCSRCVSWRVAGHGRTRRCIRRRLNSSFANPAKCAWRTPRSPSPVHRQTVSIVWYRTVCSRPSKPNSSATKKRWFASRFPRRPIGLSMSASPVFRTRNRWCSRWVRVVAPGRSCDGRARLDWRIKWPTVAAARTTPATSATSMTSNLNATAAPCRSISLPRLVEE